MYDFTWHGQLMGWFASLSLENKARHELGLPQAVCEYEDIFPDELPRLPPHRDKTSLLSCTLVHCLFL